MLLSELWWVSTKLGTTDRMKFLVSILLVLVLLSCSEEKYVTLTGKTMGTYYSIQYKSDVRFTVEIDSILSSFISAASTYDSLSEISDFNKTGELTYRSPYLYQMLSQAKVIHQMTFGAFEPTLMPLIKAHGFNTSVRKSLSQKAVDSLLNFVSFNYIEFDSVKMKRLKPGVQLDFSAMGEGFAIELLTGFLEGNGITNYKVEIGGEMKCRGKNPNNEYWLIGIEDPLVKRTPLSLVRLKNEAISTSGISRKFYKDTMAKKHSHLIDPKTGNSIENNLLSVTIKNKNAVMADALATACMVMGYDSAVAFIERSQLDAMIVLEENGKVQSWASRNFIRN